MSTEEVLAVDVATRRSALLVVTAAVLVSAAGCSGGHGSSSASSNGSETIRVITSGQQSLNFIGVEGDLNQWGPKLSVKQIAGDSGTVSAALAGGTADVGLQAGGTAGLAIAKGLKAKIIGAMILPWNQYLIASTKSGATKSADLKGKKFGITSFGSGGDYATETMAKKLGWSKGDYKLIQIGGGAPGLVAALKSGAIDAFYWSSDVAYQAQADGFAKVIDSAVDYVGPTAFEVFIATDDVIKQHPDAVKAFMGGYVDAIKQIEADPSKAEKIMTTWGKTPSVGKQSVKDVLPQLDENGLIPAKNLQGLEDAVSFLSQGSVGQQDPSSWYEPWTKIS